MPYKDREKQKEYSLKYYNENKSAARERNLKKTFGLSVDEYNQLLEDQKFSCAICEGHVSEFTRALAVDHCHETGKVRGLLCRGCNTGLGSLGDSIEGLSKAIEYLRRT